MSPSLPVRLLLPILPLSCLTLAADLAAATDLFENPVFYQVGDRPFDVAAGDFNGDEAPDLVVANVGSEDISVLFNDGVGRFSSEVRYLVGEPTRSVAVGDLNGDDHVDIAVGRQQASPTLAILYNNGDGTFAAPVLVGSFAGFPDAIQILEINEDEHLDIVIGSASVGSIAVFLGSGSGSFDEQVYPTDTDPAYPSDLAAGDLDGDQDVDLAVSASLSTSPPKFLLNLGQGTFGNHQSFTDLNVTLISVAIGDLDRNDTEDLALLDFSAAAINVYSNEGPAEFGAATAYPIGTSTQPGGKVRLGDLDGDGWLDAAVAPILSNPVVPVLLGDGEGGFGAPVHYSAGHSPSAITLVDLDRDSDLDLLVTSADEDNVAVLINRSTTPSAVPAISAEAAEGFWLGPARPNPTRGLTSIAFRLPQASRVTLRVFDVLGQTVRVLLDEERGAGPHRVTWDGETADGRTADGGVYLYQIEAGRFRATGKLERTR